MTTPAELMENAKEYIEDADLLFSKGHYNSAMNLYFKALVALCDYVVLRDTDRLPRNHTERFRILKERYLDLYEVVDFHFNYYRSSYMKRVEREWVEVLRDDVHRVYSSL